MNSDSPVSEVVLLTTVLPSLSRSSLHSYLRGECTTLYCAFTPFIWYFPFYFHLGKLDQVFLLWQVFHDFTVPHWQGLEASCSGLNSYFWMHWLLCFKKQFSNCLLLKLVVSFQSRFKCCSLHGSWHRRCTIIICWIEFKY